MSKVSSLSLLLIAILAISMLPGAASSTDNNIEPRQETHDVNIYLHGGTNLTMSTVPPQATPSVQPGTTFSFPLVPNPAKALHLVGTQENLQLRITRVGTSDVPIEFRITENGNIVTNVTETVGGTTRDLWDIPLDHTFSKGSSVVFEIEASGTVNLNYGTTADPAHLIFTADHLQSADIRGGSYDQDGDPEGEFEPNLPEEERVLVISGEIEDGFGPGDVSTVQVRINDPDGNEVFSDAATLDTETNPTYALFESTWNYEAGYTAGTYEAWIDVTDQSENTVINSFTFSFSQYGVYVFCPNPNGNAAAGTDIIYTVRVTNSGSSSDTIALAASNPSSWSTSFADSSLSLGGGQSQDTELTVSIPASEQEGKRVNILITGTSNADPSKAHSIQVSAQVKARYDFTFIADTTQQEIEAGENATYTLTATNTGQAHLCITFSIPEGPSSADDWEIELLGGVEIEPEEDYIRRHACIGVSSAIDLTLIVTAPNNPDITSQPVDILAVADNDTTLQEMIRTTTTIEGATPPPPVGELDLRAAASELKKTSSVKDENVDPVEYTQVTFTLTIENGGDEDITVDFSAKKPSVSWTVDTPSSQTLDAGDQRSIQVSVTPSSDSIYKKEGHEVTITATASAISSSKSVVLTVDVEQFYSFTVTEPIEKSKDVEMGNALYTFAIKNRGNGPDTISFSAVTTKADWSAIFLQNSLVLEPGAQGSVQLTISAPEDLQEDETTVTDVIFKSQGSQKQQLVTLETSAKADKNSIGDLIGEPYFLIVLFAVIILIIVSIYLRHRTSS